MYITCIIAEFNPFHNGHKLLIDKAKANSDAVIVLMSGDFVQRGEPAIFSKYTRALMALRNGADAVIELPVLFSLGSAEYFSEGAVRLLNKLNVNEIIFGSESADKEVLEKEAEIILNEPPEYKENLRLFQKEGLSFPSAQEKAFLKMGLNKKFTPNDILAREYIKAIKKTSSSINVRVIKRKDNYHSLKEEEIPSATSIRKLLKEEKEITGMPKSASNILHLDENIRGPIFPSDINSALYYKLLSLDNYTSFLDVNTSLSNRITNNLDSYDGFLEFAFLLKTKNLTLARIKRSLMHILLGITTKSSISLRLDEEAFALRVLGINKSSKAYSYLKKNSLIPLISSTREINSLTLRQKEFLSYTSNATRLYEGILKEKYNLPYNNELKRRFLTEEKK